MADLNDADNSEIESSRSPTVSFPDHYLVPYIERCKKSKRVTCGCSLFWIGLAIFCFFATNYMLNYPVTESRKIAFVFGGVFCLVAAVSCLNLRCRIAQGCEENPNDTVMFEMRRRDFELSDSFSAHLAMYETPFCNGTHSEERGQKQTSEDSISRAQTIDDPCFAAMPRVQRNGPTSLPPRRSISDGVTPDTPLLPQRNQSELSRQSLVQNKKDLKLLQKNGIVSDNNRYPPNYSTFENGDTEPLLAESTYQNGCDASETDPLLAESMYQNGCDASETEPLLSKEY